MKFPTIAAAAALALAPMSASAVTATIIDQSTNGGGNTADTFGSPLIYGAFTPTGAEWDDHDLDLSEDPPVVDVPPSFVSAAFLSPFENTPIEDERDFFSVGGSSGDSGSPSPRFLDLGGDFTSFSLLWGSIDTYNTLEFLDDGSTVGTFTGTNIVNLINSTFGSGTASFNSGGNSNHVALVSFMAGSGEAFDTLKFSSERPDGVTDWAAFEFATPVPVPAGALLFGTAFVIAGVARRYGRKSA
jgi:hypothetical protein